MRASIAKDEEGTGGAKWLQDAGLLSYGSGAPHFGEIRLRAGSLYPARNP